MEDIFTILAILFMLLITIIIGMIQDVKEIDHLNRIHRELDPHHLLDLYRYPDDHPKIPQQKQEDPGKNTTHKKRARLRKPLTPHSN